MPPDATPLRCLLLLIARPAAPTLFPYTTLFRSLRRQSSRLQHGARTGEGVTEARAPDPRRRAAPPLDRKSTRLNSSHSQISYAVFCLKKKKITQAISRPVRLAASNSRYPATAHR